jgi:hypothetical protein
MGLTQKLGTIPLAIFTDASNNVGIGITPTTRLTIGRVDSSSEGAQIDLCRASDNTNAWGIDIFGNTSTPSFRILDNVAGAARMIIDGTGRVGFGLSPTYALDVANSSSPSLRVRNGALGGTSTLLLETANNFSGTCQTFIQCIGSVGNGTSQLAFGTAGASGDATATERMRITGGGNVGIGPSGTASSAVRLVVSGADQSASNYSFISTDSAGSTLLFTRNDGYISTGTAVNSPCNTTTTNAANLHVFTSNGALARSTASSIRFKENVTDWDGNGLDTILALKPKTFTYKSDYYSNPDLVMLGLIAEEVAEVSPYLAEYENEDRTGQIENVRYANIVVPLIKAIQELNAKVSALENKS